jgi:hypothetical protein
VLLHNESLFRYRLILGTFGYTHVHKVNGTDSINQIIKNIVKVRRISILKYTNYSELSKGDKNKYHSASLEQN